MAGDCKTLCCGGFSQNEKTAERVPNPKLRPIDRCNNRSNYFGKLGEDFKLFMPVRATAVAGEVEPAPDCVDVIGVATCAKTAIEDDKIINVARTGTICWSDMAASLGIDFDDQDTWWKHHVALSAINIYVEYV